MELLAREAEHLIGHVQTRVVRRDHTLVCAHLLAGLLDDLADKGITELVLESRQAANDVMDKEVIAAARRAGRISTDLVYGHQRPSEEPLLWLADALAGAVMARVRGDPGYLASLPATRLVLRGL
jgi:hypothetical protein